MREYLGRYGKLLALYSDKASIFLTNKLEAVGRPGYTTKHGVRYDDMSACRKRQHSYHQACLTFRVSPVRPLHATRVVFWLIANRLLHLQMLEGVSDALEPLHLWQPDF